MATGTVPASSAKGKYQVWIGPATAIADHKAPKLSEVSAITMVALGGYMTLDGFNLSTDQASISDVRLTSEQDFELPGTKKYTLAITGVDNTNTEYETEFNELVEMLEEGADLVAVHRRGAKSDAALAVDQAVTVVPFRPGVKSDIAPEENSVQRSKWACFITGDVEPDVKVVAGA